MNASRTDHLSGLVRALRLGQRPPDRETGRACEMVKKPTTKVAGSSCLLAQLLHLDNAPRETRRVLRPWMREADVWSCRIIRAHCMENISKTTKHESCRAKNVPGARRLAIGDDASGHAQRGVRPGAGASRSGV